MQYLSQLNDAVRFLRGHIGDPPDVSLVLGSGLGAAFASQVESERLNYSEIPHFPVSSVVGHAGQLAWGRHRGTRFCALMGRVHLYEGLEPRRVVFAVRALAMWGCRNFLITNAAGAVNREMAPGQLMLITDHINLQGANPLEGDNYDDLGQRFPDMSDPYHPDLRRLALQCARQLGIELRQGVYIAVRGPSYETPAEIRMCRTLGADAVGMSTVPEVIALNHMKRRVAGISCLTNMAAGILDQPLVHDEVLQVTERVKEDFARLVLSWTERMGA
ncbi:MAG TPA: purine-nucleoside phosphorylase [Acidobacteriota bacterium]|nr:purine-nucleoside phosphorylase [Acidobacteriota bacterium]